MSTSSCYGPFPALLMPAGGLFMLAEKHKAAAVLHGCFFGAFRQR
jgi:hypothetical protein